MEEKNDVEKITTDAPIEKVLAYLSSQFNMALNMIKGEDHGVTFVIVANTGSEEGYISSNSTTLSGAFDVLLQVMSEYEKEAADKAEE